MVHNVVIIGSGPAGLTAAIYTARANLSPLLIGGYQEGGQLMTTTDVENYPGFPDGIMGPELMELWKKQAIRFGAKLIAKDATGADLKTSPFKIMVENEVFESRTVIIATGAQAKYLGLESERRLMGKGVSACATCDGAFFKGEKLAVVGGGDTAMEEALFLTRFAEEVNIIHRRDKLRASKVMQEKAFKNPKIKFIFDSEVVEVLGENTVTGVKIKNLKTGKTSNLAVGGLFAAIGHSPNTKIFAGQLDMVGGYIVTENKSTRTKIPGVFAAGDVQDHYYRQAVTAAGSGCMAAIDAEGHLESLRI